MITTETAVMAILVLILVMCLILYWMLHIIHSKLKSIEVDLMCLESRQKSMVQNQEIMDTKVDYNSTLLEEIEEMLEDTETNETKEELLKSL